MPPTLTFVRFELQKREHSPNAVIGITDDDKRVFMSAPASALGKQLGDQIALLIKAALEREYVNHTLRLKLRFSSLETSMVECPDCHHKQEHTSPMSGKLYCQGCGELLDQIIA